MTTLPTSFRYFLTGPPGCGKTTAVLRIVGNLQSAGVKVGGVVSGELRQGGVRVGFEVIDLQSSRRGVLAQVSPSGAPRVGKYTVNLRDLSEVAASAVESATASCDAVVIDEVGPMELYSDDFVRATELALASRKTILGTVHRNARHPLVDKIKSDPGCTVVVLTEENRKDMSELLSARIIEAIKAAG